MSKETLFVIFRLIITALNGLAPKIIRWPNETERRIISNNFAMFAGIKGIVGTVDGTNVKIKASKENPEVYINRKCFYGILSKQYATTICNFQIVLPGILARFGISEFSEIRIFMRNFCEMLILILMRMSLSVIKLRNADYFAYLSTLKAVIFQLGKEGLIIYMLIGR